MKKCSKCKVEKDVNQFNKNKAMKDGLNYWCKKCCQEYLNKYRKTYTPPTLNREDREARNKYHNKYRSNNLEKCREANKKYQKKYRLNNLEKCNAQDKLNNAIKMGKITRQPCSICGNPKSNGHHPDYSKPLEVIWLCAKHHQELHRIAIKFAKK